jgi:hypothetical protein
MQQQSEPEPGLGLDTPHNNWADNYTPLAVLRQEFAYVEGVWEARNQLPQPFPSPKPHQLQLDGVSQ